MNFLGFIWKMLPSDYKWSVATKKVAWTIVKTGVSLLAGTKLGKEISPEHWVAVSEVSVTLIAGGMKLVHDWAKMKYPEAKWL